MIKRIVDIAEPAYLHLKHRQLLIDKNNVTAGKIPVEDLGVLILQHPAIVITQKLMISCQQNNVAVIFCDEKHLPYSTVLPIAESNRLHQKILKQQISITEPTRKRLWQQIVKQKIARQALTLQRAGKDNLYLMKLIPQVKSDDRNNGEATAARFYWQALFGKSFIRDTNRSGINALLNYGYAIVRAAVARSICAAGLHPGLGIFHHNQYNALCLADDLMEPFRPWVDDCVYQIHRADGDLSVNQENKRKLLAVVNQPVLTGTGTMPLLVALHYLMADLKRCYVGEMNKLIYPELVLQNE